MTRPRRREPAKPALQSHLAHLGTSCRKSQRDRESKSKTPEIGARHGHPVPTRVPSCANAARANPLIQLRNDASPGEGRTAALTRESHSDSRELWSKSPSKQKYLLFSARLAGRSTVTRQSSLRTEAGLSIRRTRALAATLYRRCRRDRPENLNSLVRRDLQLQPV